MATGTVKWFNNAKGYGFVIAEAGGEDLFAHYSSIQMDGYKTLKAGQSVEFDIEQGPKGLHAVNIKAFEPHATRSTPDSSQADRETNADDRVAKPAFSNATSRTEYAESR
jgi:CspA family cold shock protein